MLHLFLSYFYHFNGHCSLEYEVSNVSVQSGTINSTFMTINLVQTDLQFQNFGSIINSSANGKFA